MDKKAKRLANFPGEQVPLPSNIDDVTPREKRAAFIINFGIVVIYLDYLHRYLRRLYHGLLAIVAQEHY